MAVWFMESKLDLREGGEAIYHLADPFGGTISRLEPPHLLEVDQGEGYLRFKGWLEESAALS